MCDDDLTSYNEVLRRCKRKSLPSPRTALPSEFIRINKSDSEQVGVENEKSNDGSIQRYTARNVVKNCSQRPGLDYNEVYSPVVQNVTVR